MRKVLFAAYGGFDFPMISPVFPFLRRKGYELAVMNRYDLAPSRRQLRGLTCFQPPDVSDRLLSADEIERALPTFLDTGSLQHLIPLWRGRTPGLRYLAGWHDHYFAFALETLHRYDPDLLVLSLGEAETSIIRRVCDLTSRRYACLVPQRYEFKSIETFETHDGPTYLVAGDYGRERLIRKGVKPDNVLVTGNPRFDDLLAIRNSEARGPDPEGSGSLGFRGLGRRRGPRRVGRTILYPLQGVSTDGRLFQLLRRYVVSRRGVRLVLRPHPNRPPSSWPAFTREAIAGPVSLARQGPLGRVLQVADVLVTSWSLTTLEALITGTPVISWKSDFLPDELPFASAGDTLRAHTYAELADALDRLLFDADFRAAWVEGRRDAHVPYTGVLDGQAALRVADAIAALIESGTMGRRILGRPSA
jgi:glycosyltransferase involved in cell wall biosynthesis